MKIGIIGTGNVGGTLGTCWARKGHQVMFGARDLADTKLQRLLTRSDATASTVQDAAAFGDVVVIAVPWPATEEAIQNAGKLSGKILLDCTNPITTWPRIAMGNGISGGEQVGQWAGGAAVVKIFNTTSYANMANPNYGSEPVTMFYAADDSSAKVTASQLASDLGFDPVDAGPLANSRFLEMIASFWGVLAFEQKLGLEIAFRLLRR
jgi:predicted dinucleotide-binding enzyme